MAGRVLLKKFGIVNSNTVESPIQLYAGKISKNNSEFTNTYGVWNTPSQTGAKLIATRRFNAPVTGVYKLRATVDNSGSVYIDNVKLVGTPQTYNLTPTAINVTLTAGEHILKFEVVNSGGQGTLSCTISDSTDTQVLWDTRTYAVVNNITSSTYTMTPAFAGTVTAHIWGGGGGGGSGDSGAGGSGSPGLYNTTSFSFDKGDTIEVAIGSGGSEGISGSPQQGGAGGQGRINVDGSAEHSFNGGKGGDGPVSGAGGGGGGATAILVNGQLVIAAGGGGAGGGAGSKGNSQNGKSATLSPQSVSPNWRAGNGPKTIFGTAEYCVLPPANIAVNKDTFTFYLYFDKVGAYKFSGSADNQAKFYIDDVLAFQALDWGTTATGTFTITQAGFHKVGIYYYSDGQGGSGFGIQVNYPNDTPFWQTSKSGVSKNGSQTNVYFLPTNTDDYRGQDGQTRTNDGGTGGGGGGGYPGGLGGKCNTGDSGAEAGQAGGNFPLYQATRGSGTPYYNSSYGAAGPPSTKGKDGYAVLEIVPVIEYVSGSSIKVAGSWKQITTGYVKVAGSWRQITASYVKKNGTWRPIVSAGDQSSIEETASITNYGQIQRPYS